MAFGNRGSGSDGRRRMVNPSKAEKLMAEYKDKIIKHKVYIIKYGADPEEITNWQWQKNF